MITKKIVIIITAVLIAITLLPVLAAAWGPLYANIAATDNADDGFIFNQPKDTGFYEITADQLRDRIEDKSDDNFIIIDIRDNASYDEGHIPGAVNIPLNELGYRVFGLDKTADIIVYCFTGITSKVACRILVNAGFKDVYDMTGGIKAWDYALETSDGRINI
ncbi:MAG TPA: rhodanese-like domain-containing protein [Planctomycetes bacterium]|nr:rhodanese-like domain-containing protein [Planctomycetota bacterium]